MQACTALQYDVQIYRFWSSLTAIKSLVLADECIREEGIQLFLIGFMQIPQVALKASASPMNTTDHAISCIIPVQVFF